MLSKAINICLSSSITTKKTKKYTITAQLYNNNLHSSENDSHIKKKKHTYARTHTNKQSHTRTYKN